ncbi:MAG TPA: hypothetical protein VNM72_09400 [Blastocatellia bacterium]|nr:hypothetical protein [Blastocatellia bacterium]
MNVARRGRILNTPFTNPAVDPHDWRLRLRPGVGRRPQEGSQTCNVWFVRDATTRLEEAQQRWFVAFDPSPQSFGGRDRPRPALWRVFNARWI